MEVALVGADWWHVDSATKHLRASEAKSLYSPFWDEYLTFSFTRSYEDRERSYRDRWCQNGEPNDTKPISWWLDEEIDFIGRYSHLQEDWSRLCALLGVDLELPWRR